MSHEIVWNDVYRDYYIEKLSNTAILEKHKINAFKNIHEAFPMYVHEKLFCEYCKSPLSSKFMSKSASKTCSVIYEDISGCDISRVDEVTVYGSRHYGLKLLAVDDGVIKTDERYSVSFPFCDKCDHKPSKYCSCGKCVALKNNNKSAAMKVFKESENFGFDGVCSIASLTAEEILFSLFSMTYFNKDNNFVEAYCLGEKAREILLSTALFQIESDSIAGCVSMISTFEYNIHKNKLLYRVKSLESDEFEKNLELLKRVAYKKYAEIDYRMDIVDLWCELAMDEAIGVLRHYCEIHKMECRPGEQTLSSIKRSLSKYGLAQTARYICNAVRYASRQGLEKGLNRLHTFNLVCGSLNFWVDDTKTKDWDAKPFFRGEQILSEPEVVIVFSHTFLAPVGIDYFTGPISMTLIEAKVITP